MKYNPPFGSGNPNAPYVDRNTPNAQSGSKVPAAAVEDPQREIVRVITGADLTPDGNSTTQLWEALQILLDGVRTELPIYPNCRNEDGMFGVLSPATGTIRVPAGVVFVIRGARRYVTEQVNLPTTASKVYHLRWNKTDGFALYNLASAGYNPGSLAEDHASFDSTFDDMLVARVVTNGSNVPVTTNLTNKPKLAQKTLRLDAVAQALSYSVLPASAVVLNWARTPDMSYVGMKGFRSQNSDADGSPIGPSAGKVLAAGVNIPASGITRYGVPNLEYYYEDDAGNLGWISSTVFNIAF
ncbi:MAG: hypothetical protein JWR80_8020 [Bradyrhizobium sp.]|nr:hypothetical protein [Bradyrhizobium sp.]